MPTDPEINNYFYKLSLKTGISASSINIVGHQAGPPTGGNIEAN